MKPSFVLEPARCTGCEACRVACCIENRLPLARSFRTVHHANSGREPGRPVFHLSLACAHCERPACLEGCPAGAYARDPSTGAVLLDEERCLGCGYCAWVCPYGAPRLDEAQGVMSKCTFCHRRLLEGAAPACAAVCPTGALRVEPRGDDAEPRFPGLPALGLGPALRVVGAPRPAPEQSAVATVVPALSPHAAPRPGLREHWSLALFTSVAIGLFAAFAGWLSGGVTLPAWGFAALGAAAAGASLFHLGRPERAWRALGNLRRSWVSREIAAFGTFAAGCGVVTGMNLRGDPGGHSGWAWGGTVLCAGFALLVSIDRLYQVAERRPFWSLRASEALPTGLFLGAVMAGQHGEAAVIAIARILLAARGGWLGILQAAGSIAWLLGWRLGLPWASLLAVVLALELAGRASFYAGMDTRRPRVDVSGPVLP